MNAIFRSIMLLVNDPDYTACVPDGSVWERIGTFLWWSCYLGPAFDRECDAPWVVSGEAAEVEGGIVLSGEVGEVDRCLPGVVSRGSDGIGRDEAPGNR